jgi:hypothetical protein
VINTKNRPRNTPTLERQDPYVVKLSLSKTNAGVFLPPAEMGWSYSPVDIHARCGDEDYVYVCFKKAYVTPPVGHYGIADVMVCDQRGTAPSEYTGLTYNLATTPYIPGEVGEKISGADVNTGIGGDTTAIWAKYINLDALSDPNTRVLRDIAVVNWPTENWNARCPEGDLFSNGEPCPHGWQRANGTSGGRQGALTTGTESACSRNGLCVRYTTLGNLRTNGSPYVAMLSLSLSSDGKNPVVYPQQPAAWDAAGSDIHMECGDKTYIHVCSARRYWTPAASPKTTQEKRDLLARYAPKVWLSGDGGADFPVPEQCYPSSVEFAFSCLERELRDGNYSLSTSKDWKDTANTTFYAGDRSLAAPVYAFMVDKGQAGLHLVYFFYYPFNVGKMAFGQTWGNHVSDWEHITVRLVDGQPDSVYFAQHSWGDIRRWDQVSKEGTHPIVYSAWGSHASYPFAGSYTYGRAANYSLIDECSAGVAWNTWERLEGFDYDAQAGLGTTPWPVWMSTSYSDPGKAGTDPSVPGNGPILYWGNPEQGCFVPARVGA